MFFVVECLCDLKLLTAPDAYIAISSRWLSPSEICMDGHSLSARSGHQGTRPFWDCRAPFPHNVLHYDHSLGSLHFHIQVQRFGDDKEMCQPFLETLINQQFDVINDKMMCQTFGDLSLRVLSVCDILTLYIVHIKKKSHAELYITAYNNTIPH